MGGSKAPKPDPAVGKAAMMQAQIGREQLAFNKRQAAITNKWAQEDRNFYNQTFRPMEEQFVEEAANYDTPARRQQEGAQARASVAMEAAQAADAEERALAATGVDPRSGRSQSSSQRRSLAVALSKAGADATARRNVEAVGDAKEMDAVNLGRGYAVNPGTSMGMATNTGNAGFTGAMNGYANQASILNSEYQQRMNSYNAQQSSRAGMLGAVGKIAGAAFALSSKDAKTKKSNAEARSLAAVKKMDIDEWQYKPGMADEGTHVGPYAEDFTKQTGLGDGRSINLVDAMGTTMGAVKELSKKVDQLSKGRSLKSAA